MSPSCRDGQDRVLNLWQRVRESHWPLSWEKSFGLSQARAEVGEECSKLALRLGWPWWAPTQGGHGHGVKFDGALAVILLSPGWVPWEMPLMMVRQERREQGRGGLQ